MARRKLSLSKGSPRQQLPAQLGHPAAELEQLGVQHRGPGDGALRSAAESGAGGGAGGDQAQPSGLGADEQRHVLNQLLGAVEPMGAIEPHRLGIGVVTELHGEDREGLQAAKVLHISPGL